MQRRKMSSTNLIKWNLERNRQEEQKIMMTRAQNTEDKEVLTGCWVRYERVMERARGRESDEENKDKRDVTEGIHPQASVN